MRRGRARRAPRLPEIDRVGFLHMEFIGPGVVLLVAAVDLVEDRPEADAARELRRLEAELYATPARGPRVPHARRTRGRGGHAK